MSGAVCPACGVAVVPGYVRCPRCHKPLPRRASPAVARGGTALEHKRRLPLIGVIAVAVLGGGLIVFLGLRSSDEPTQAAPAAPVEPAGPNDTEPAQPTAAEPAQLPAATGPDPAAVAGTLERALKRERLWSTVTVVGDRVEVRSGSCGDPQMAPLLDGAAPALKAAGLTKLRCVEQSGRVVSDRDL